MELSERKKTVLSSIIEQYIQTGEPVGSKAVCSALNSSCSPATIRNDMVELIEQGYLLQPHTSAGRIPSNKGYRLYINSLMKKYSLTQQDKQYIDSLLPRYFDEPESFVAQVGTALASLTRCAAVTTSPIDNAAAISRVEALNISGNTVLLVVMTSGGLVKNRICRCEIAPSREDTECFVNVVNHITFGIKLEDITPAVIQNIGANVGSRALVLAPVVNGFYHAVQDLINPKLRYEGEVNLLNHSEFSPANLLQLMNFLRHRESIASLLRRGTAKTEVFIGEETDEKALESASVISARYSDNGHIGGRIAIIGPTRLDYSHIIPSIEYLADSVQRILCESEQF